MPDFFRRDIFNGFRVILVWVEACLKIKTPLFPILHRKQCYWGFFFNESQENVNFKQLGLNIFTIPDEPLRMKVFPRLSTLLTLIGVVQGHPPGYDL